MKEILKTIISNLVENKEAVGIEEVKEDKKIAQNDMGKVIGKQGRIAQSIRTVMKAVAGKEKMKVAVEFIEE